MKKPEPQQEFNFKFDLFQTTKELNLSPVYEEIPKSVKKNDPNVVWINENIASPLEKRFFLDENLFTLEITPAVIKNKKTGDFQSVFPGHREDKVEYAIISLASKEIIEKEEDKKGNQIFLIKISYYQIQKEIVDAINKEHGKNLKVNGCPYNVADIKKALEILKTTSYKLNSPDKKTGIYIFNRIKDIYLQDKKVVIELGGMISKYIQDGNWSAVDKSSILASKGGYELKLRILFNLKFRYASITTTYSASLNSLISKLEINKGTNKRTALQNILNILNKMKEVESVDVERRYEKNKLIDAILTIHPSKDFVSKIIKKNKLTKRVKKGEYVIDSGVLYVKSIRDEFSSGLEFEKASAKFQEIKLRQLKNISKKFFLE